MPPTNQSHPLEVVLADDHEQLLTLYETFLGDKYHTKTATNGKEAIEATTPDTEIIFLDRDMPTLNGIETIKKLRQEGVPIPIAMVTAKNPTTDIINIGVDDYIRKPIHQEQLKTVTEALLYRKTLSEEERLLLAKLSKRRAIKNNTSVSHRHDPDFINLNNHIAEIYSKIPQQAETIVTEDPRANITNLESG